MKSIFYFSHKHIYHRLNWVELNIQYTRILITYLQLWDHEWIIHIYFYFSSANGWSVVGREWMKLKGEKKRRTTKKTMTNEPEIYECVVIIDKFWTKWSSIYGWVQFSTSKKLTQCLFRLFLNKSPYRILKEKWFAKYAIDW